MFDFPGSTSSIVRLPLHSAWIATASSLADPRSTRPWGAGLDSEQQVRSNSGDVSGRGGFGFRF
jgi:hypothetical protein